jgi:hypothetical protein
MNPASGVPAASTDNASQIATQQESSSEAESVIHADPQDTLTAACAITAGECTSKSIVSVSGAGAAETSGDAKTYVP